MLKCVRCNRDRLPTAEYTVRTMHTPTRTLNKKVTTGRLCGACAALTISTHGAENVKRIKGSEDGGIPAAVTATVEEFAGGNERPQADEEPGS